MRIKPLDTKSKIKQTRDLYAFIAANPKATVSEYARCMNNKVAVMQGEFHDK